MLHDWFVIGFDPIDERILVKCRLTRMTGVVVSPALHEKEAACAQSFEPYPWVEHERVVLIPVKKTMLELSKSTQRLSGILKKTQSLGIHIE